MKLSKKARREQDYWLSFGDVKVATDEERQEFLRFDSQGGAIHPANPIWLGKIRHGQTGEVLKSSYFDLDSGWIGGLVLYQDYAQRSFGLRSLIEWFGSEAVDRWRKASL